MRSAAFRPQVGWGESPQSGARPGHVWLQLYTRDTTASVANHLHGAAVHSFAADAGMSSQPSKPEHERGGSSPLVRDRNLRGAALSGEDTLLSSAAARRSSLRDLARGRAVGRYVILERIGAGGMGVVFAAYDPKLDRRIAIKILTGASEGIALDTSASVRLQREGQAMAKLLHPNVVTVFDVGTIDDALFIAMEFVEGQTLRAWREEGPGVDATWEDIVRKYVAAGRGLQAAHAAGIVHRDFKPDNCMVTSSGDVKVLDFGLARSEFEVEPEVEPPSPSNSSLDARLTATGAVMGTPYFMAPEQHAGKPVDAATDQFSFCVALYLALFEQRPFAGESIVELATSVSEGMVREPPRSAKVPAGIRAAVLRGLSRDPADRHPSMQALLGALQPQKRRRPVFLLAGSAVIATVAAAAIVAVDRPEPCAGVDAPVAELWSPDRREALSLHLATQDIPPSRRDAALEAFDEFEANWATGRTEACTAARVDRRQSEATLELREACFDSHLADFAFALQRVDAADRTTLYSLHDIATGLPDLSICDDVETLETEFPLPEDPSTRKKVRDLTVRLDALRASRNRGDLERMLTEHEAFDADAVAADYLPLIVRGRAQWGEVEVFAGHAEQGAERIESAYLQAIRGDARRAAANILVKLVRTRGERLRDIDTAEFLADLGSAMLQTLPRAEVTEVNLELALGRSLSVAGKLEQAERHLRSVVEKHQELGLSRTSVGIQARAFLGWVLLKRQRPKAGVALLEEALEHGTEVLGRVHPEIATALIYRARAHSMVEEFEAALAALEQAREVLVALYGASHYNVMAVDGDMATICLRSGRFAEGKKIIERALTAEVVADGPLWKSLRRIYIALARLAFQSGDLATTSNVLGLIEEKRNGPSDVPLPSYFLLRGRVELLSGNRNAALNAYTRALELLGEDAPEASFAYCGLAEVAFADDDISQAVQHLDQAIELAEKHDEPTAAARAGVVRAQLYLQRGQAAQARKQLEQAKLELTENPAEAKLAQTIERLLAQLQE